MSIAFRDLLRKVGSGTHTGQDLTRSEAAMATRMMLLQEATPAQIGAFMIAHRIKRPTGEELAGMLDAYDELGPKLQPIERDRPVLVLSAPYDGRDRTVPLGPLTALVLVASGHPVIMHGGGRMPTKEGIPLIEVWRGLGVDWAGLPLPHIQSMLERLGLGFVYLPDHFSLAQGLVPYREQIGKRPPFATLELLWSPYAGSSRVVVGYVHPPTEGMARKAFALRGTEHFITVKGLEGSCDLPRERTAIVGLSTPNCEFERLHLHPQEYGFGSRNVAFEGTEAAIAAMHSVLRGEPSELRQSLLWSSGFYLWQGGGCPDLATGIATAANLLDCGQVLQTLHALKAAIAIPQALRC